MRASRTRPFPWTPAPRTARELRLELPASMDFLDPAEEAAVCLARTLGLPEEEAYYLRVALHEALTNAVRHGCQSDPRRRVGFSLRVLAHDLRISVADEGPGFDPRQIPDPLAETNLSRAGGRGIFYMRRFTDELSFSFPPQGGTVVRLRKRLQR